MYVFTKIFDVNDRGFYFYNSTESNKMADQDADVTTPLLSHSDHHVNRYQSDRSTRTRNKFFSLITVEPALLLYLLYKTGLGPVGEQYIYLRISEDMNMTSKDSTASVCHVNQSTTDYIKQQKIQSETSLWMIYFSISSMIPALMATVFIGGYTDNGGRKIGLISPIIGGIVQIYLLLCTEIFHLPIWFILIGGFLEGLSGGIAMFLMAAFSYISDKTSRSQRSLRIIILEMVIGCSSTISFLLSGYMIQTIGFLGTTLVLHVIVVLDLCVVFMMPESLPANEHAKFWTLKHFKNSINVYTTDDTSGKRRLALLTSLLILFFLIPARLGTDSVQILFMLNRPLCWDSAFIGYFKGLYYLTSTIGSILLTKLAQPKVGDLQLLIVGCISAVLHLVFWAFVKTSLMMFLGMVSCCIYSIR